MVAVLGLWDVTASPIPHLLTSCPLVDLDEVTVLDRHAILVINLANELAHSTGPAIAPLP